MNSRSNFIFSGCLVVLLTATLVVVAQNPMERTLFVPNEVDSLNAGTETVPSAMDTTQQAASDSAVVRMAYPFVRQVGLVLDYGKILGYLSGVEKKNEIGIQLNVKKSLMLVAEAGYSILNPNNALVNADYEIKGSYMRIGAGINQPITPQNNLTFSMRYGMATFEDQGTVMITSASGLYEPYEEAFSRSSLSASWFELVIGSEKSIKPTLDIGFYFRVRVMDKYDAQEPYDVFAVPGYGRTFDKSVPALNLYLRYNIIPQREGFAR